MSNKRSRRHHYVAESFQKRFCDIEGKLWYAERSENGAFTVERRSPKGCFWRPNLNTTIENDKPTDVLERQFWQAVDQDVVTFLNFIDKAFAAKKVPTVDGEDLVDFKLLFSLIARRSPDATELPSVEVVGQLYRSEIKKAVDARLLTSDAKHDDPIWLRQNGRAILARAKASFPARVLEALKPYRVRWGVPAGKHSFILGSKSVYRAHGEGGTGHLEDPMTELFWPLRPKLALVLLRPPESGWPMITKIERDQVRAWNASIASSSMSFASHSEKLIRSIVKSA